MFKRGWAVWLTGCVLLAGCQATSPATPGSAPPQGQSRAHAQPRAPVPTAARRRSSCDRLSLRQQAAQTVMSAIPGTSMSRASRRLVATHAGSVILFDWNVAGRAQLRALTVGLRRAAPTRLLVAVDEEGGRVSRLGAAGVVDQLPAPRRLAATRTTQAVRRLGRRLGRQMRAAGVNWNLAPVLDVTAARSSTIIGDRAWASTPQTVARYARAFANGLQTAGVATTGKHFPGHGRTTIDSHHALPTIKATRRQLLSHDLRPYQAARRVLDAVMSAHVVYPALDRTRPASLSPATARLLRARLGFHGLLITDALDMQPIRRALGVPRAAERAIRAGADIALLGGNWRHTPAATQRILQAVRTGRISHARLTGAARRVLHAKGYPATIITCMLAPRP